MPVFPPDARHPKYASLSEAEVREKLCGRLSRFALTQALAKQRGWTVDEQEFYLVTEERRMIRELGYAEPAEQLLLVARKDGRFLRYEEAHRLWVLGRGPLPIWR